MPSVVLLAGGIALVLVAYATSSRRSIEATTEVAALVVLGAAFLAGSGHLTLASGVIATTVLVLVEKSRLHELVGRINDEEIRAGARFGVMAVVILPLLPDASYGPFGAFQPRALWALVLLFAGISFAGYAVRRAIAGTQGDALAGLIGGLVSSTQVTLVHARTSRSEPQRAMSLACGAIAASTVLFVRTGLARRVEPGARARLLPHRRRARRGVVASAAPRRSSSARILPAQSARFAGPADGGGLSARHRAGTRDAQWLGDTGGDLGAIAGVTDVDAATIARRGRSAKAWHGRRCQAVAAGVLANTVLKLVLAVVLGDRKFGLATGAGLAATIAAIGAVLLFWR
jgi:uncharacterized membrane protein (DUF4010 family)